MERKMNIIILESAHELTQGPSGKWTEGIPQRPWDSKVSV